MKIQQPPQSGDSWLAAEARARADIHFAQLIRSFYKEVVNTNQLAFEFEIPRQFEVPFPDALQKIGWDVYCPNLLSIGMVTRAMKCEVFTKWR